MNRRTLWISISAFAGILAVLGGFIFAWLPDVCMPYLFCGARSLGRFLTPCPLSPCSGTTPSYIPAYVLAAAALPLWYGVLRRLLLYKFGTQPRRVVMGALLTLVSAALLTAVLFGAGILLYSVLGEPSLPRVENYLADIDVWIIYFMVDVTEFLGTPPYYSPYY